MIFRIDAKLPSLNEYVSACRSHWSQGAAFKKEVETIIGIGIRRAKARGDLRAVERKSVIYIEWHERTKKRDVDNIQSAQKFILDALQKYGILPNDSRKYVGQIYHKIVDDKADFVMVELREEE